MTRKDIATMTGLVASITFVVAASKQVGPPPPPLGAPLPGLAPNDLAAFREGMMAFQEPEDALDGLGPVFNGVSCVECHNSDAVGGAARSLGVARVTRIGGLVNGHYSDLDNVGGAVLQARSLKEFNPDYPVPGERVPVEAKFVSRRQTTPLFGAGLIEAIPASAIVARANQTLPDGVHGTVNLVFNPETGKTEVGRFGWKAQHSSLHLFAGDAYLNEMGITSASFPTENKPQGKLIPPGADLVADPEDHDDDVAKFTAYMRFLAPPARRPGSPTISRGEQLFTSIGCANCHTPSMTTGPNPVAALAKKSVPLYSDLLLHHMGAALADGIVQGQATGDQFRTAPLWGLSHRPFYLHDGRATTVQAAVSAHGGEAGPAVTRYMGLKPLDRSAIDAFLRSL